MNELLKILIPILISIESGGNPHAVGDGGRAVGILQIRPVVVAEVNQILGEQKYQLQDRRDPAKSREMCRIYLTYWAEQKAITGTHREKDLVRLARLWNGGPRGDARKATLPYGKKVKKIWSRSQSPG